MDCDCRNGRKKTWNTESLFSKLYLPTNRSLWKADCSIFHGSHWREKVINGIKIIIIALYIHIWCKLRQCKEAKDFPHTSAFSFFLSHAKMDNDCSRNYTAKGLHITSEWLQVIFVKYRINLLNLVINQGMLISLQNPKGMSASWWWRCEFTWLKAPGRIVVSPVFARDREVRWGRGGKSPGPKERTEEDER